MPDVQSPNPEDQPSLESESPQAGQSLGEQSGEPTEPQTGAAEQSDTVNSETDSSPADESAEQDSSEAETPEAPAPETESPAEPDDTEPKDELAMGDESAESEPESSETEATDSSEPSLPSETSDDAAPAAADTSEPPAADTGVTESTPDIAPEPAEPAEDEAKPSAVDVSPAESTATPNDAAEEDSSASETAQSAPEQPAAPESVAPAPVASTPPEESVMAVPVSPASESEPAAVAPAPATHKPRSKKWLGVLLIIILLIIAGVVAYALTRHKSQPVATKQDIPVLTYALREAGPLKGYPLSVNTGAATEVNAQLFEGLVEYQDRSHIVPLLATGWTNPSDTQWVFTLRHGVTFHSGRPLTANDVKVSLDYAVAHQGDDNHALGVSLASTIKSVKVLATDKVEITTDGPDPTLLNRLASLYIFDSKATPGDPDAGTGPYIVKPGTTLNDNGADLVAVKNYWGGHIYTKEVKITKMTDLTAMQRGAAAGKYDLSGDYSESAIAQLHPKQTLSVEDLGVSFIVLNTLKSNSPLHVLAARQAMAYALNIPSILKASHFDGEQASQLVPSSIPGYDPSISPTPYNPTKAKQLLASVPGASAPLELMYPTGDEDPVGEVVKELDAVGFNIHATPVADFNTLISDGLGGKTDMFLISYTSDTLDGLDILGNVLVGNNDYSNPQIDALAQQASVTLDPKTRITMLQEISRKAAADVPVIPLYLKTRLYALDKPYHVVPDIPVSQSGIYFWKVYQE